LRCDTRGFVDEVNPAGIGHTEELAHSRTKINGHDLFAGSQAGNVDRVVDGPWIARIENEQAIGICQGINVFQPRSEGDIAHQLPAPIAPIGVAAPVE